MYQKQTDKIKSLYTHFWVFFDKSGKEIKRCLCTAKENIKSVESHKKRFGAKFVKKVKKI